MLAADRLHAQIDQLDVLLSLVGEAEHALVNPVEFLPHVVDRRSVGEAGGDFDLDLVAFAEIADVGDAGRRDVGAADALRHDVDDAGLLEVAPGSG